MLTVCMSPPAFEPSLLILKKGSYRFTLFHTLCGIQFFVSSMSGLFTSFSQVNYDVFAFRLYQQLFLPLLNNK